MKGFSVFSILTILFFCALGVTLVSNKLIILNDHLDAQKKLLCLKELHTQEKEFIKRINWANRVILKLKKIKILSDFLTIFFPGLGAVKVSGQKAIQALMLYQEAQAVSFLQKRLKKPLRQCLSLASLMNFPYKRQGLRFKRSSMGITIMRRKKWFYLISGRRITLKAEFQASNALQKKLKAKHQLLFGGTKGLAW